MIGSMFNGAEGKAAVHRQILSGGKEQVQDIL